MDLNFTPEEEKFRAEVRAFIRKNLDPKVAEKIRTGRRVGRDDILNWHKTLNQQGWVAPTWPEEFGGPGWNAVQQYVFEEEGADAAAPPTIPFGLRMVAPVIMKFGNPAQKDFY